MKIRNMISLGMFALFASPMTAMAHPGHGTSGLLDGLSHPIFGPDHVLAMVAVGLLAAQMGGRARWMLPVSFLTAMIAGGVLAMMGVALPYVEPAILASVVVLGVMIAAAFRMPMGAAAAIVALLAVSHGHAHGSEMPESASGLMYAVGFVIATACLHAAGLGLGLLATRMSGPMWLRVAGAATAVAGVCLVVM